MASMFQSLVERVAKLLTQSPSVSSSSSLNCSQFVEELGKLHRRMRRIEAFLSDAEEREIREKSVRLWLAELRDVAYDSEDVLDEVEYELLRHRLACEEEEHTPSSHDEGRIKGKLEDASFQQQIVTQIKKISDQLDEIYKDGSALKLFEGTGQRHCVSEPSLRAPTSCLLDEQGVRGRGDDKCKVIDMLSLNDGDVRVVSIVGTGGLGKTTLAQLVYNDDGVKNHFEKRMWVCVSDSFDVVRLTKETLQADGKSSEGDNFSLLQQRLREGLQEKRFLLVLDDVWNEDQAHWDALWVCLSSGAQGSRVLITTRSEKVSKTSRVSEANMYRLGCLLYADCWSLFEHRAFDGKSSSEYSKLVPIGREIVKKCGGLPLAVKTLAGLLFCESEEDRWMDILRSELWEIPEVEDHILPSLKLSYYHMPSHLKPCFVYCAVFPKDHWFDSDHLVRMWMAHGYIKPFAKKCMHDVGRRYIEDLLQRSFFQESNENHSHFVMHDLIHDLASSIGSGECCEVVDGRLPSDRARHLVFDCWKDIDRCLSSHGPASDNLMKRWRTSWLRGSTYGVADSALNDMFMRMKYLRVLDLHCADIKELPDSVGNLKHLRYLHIDGWGLTGLPESLGDLLNLQTLEISNNYNFSELLGRLTDLVNLQHLRFVIPSMMPRGFGRLTQLRTLPYFVVGEGSRAAGIEELTGLNHLQGELTICIKSLDNWVKWSGKEACILKNKQGLELLVLWFYDEENAMTQREQEQEWLLESLQPHPNIKEIHIRRYAGGRFPKWMGHPSYERLEYIYLRDLENCRHLPALGQLPSLKRLKVWDCGAVTSVSHEFSEAASFPSLESLFLGNLQECEGSLSIGAKGGGAFPCLVHLQIVTCPKLERVKLRHLTALRELEIRNCKELSKLHYYNDDVSVSLWRSRWCWSPPRPVLFSGRMHIPAIQIMKVWACPKLNFPAIQVWSRPKVNFPPAQRQQLLPPSLWAFDLKPRNRKSFDLMFESRAYVHCLV